MKEIFLGTFYGQEIVLKNTETWLDDKKWQKRWTDYMIILQKDAVDNYKEKEMLEKMKNYKVSNFKIFKRLLAKLLK